MKGVRVVGVASIYVCDWLQVSVSGGNFHVRKTIERDEASLHPS